MTKPSKNHLAYIDCIMLWPPNKPRPVLVTPEEDAESEPITLQIDFRPGGLDAAVAVGRWLAEVAGVLFVNTRGQSYDCRQKEQG